MVVSTISNATALRLLEGVKLRAAVNEQAAVQKRSASSSPEHISMEKHIEHIRRATEQVAAKIAAIIQENGLSNPSTRTYSATYVYGYDNVSVWAGDGTAVVNVQHNATVISGQGDDIIDTYHNAKIDTGGGNDNIDTYDNASVSAGAGNDAVETYSHSTVNLGAGNDRVSGLSYLTAYGGSGHDEIRGYDHANVDAGAGDDFVGVHGYSTVKGGAGRDTIIDSTNGADFYGHSTLDGGSGDDYIQANRDSTAIGGTGNDTVLLAGKNATVVFDKGDGRDTITSQVDFTIKLGGYTKEDVSVTADGGKFVVSFKGSHDAITLDLSSGVRARLSFDDGTTIDVQGTKVDNPIDWSFNNADYRRWQAMVKNL